MGEIEERPLMVVVAGANGSGKTSFMRDCLSREWFLPEAWINPDEIAQKIGNWNDPACVKRANIEASFRLKRLLEQRKSFAFEYVLSVYPHKFFQKAKNSGYSIYMIYLGRNSPEINAGRVMRRFLQGGHSVPIEKVGSKYLKSLSNAIRVAAISDLSYIFDASEEGPPTPVLSVRKGIINWQNGDGLDHWYSIFHDHFPENIEDPALSRPEWFRPSR